jgi:hypothetical protein
MTDLKELKEHIRWLEDERLDAAAVHQRLDEINDRLEAIVGTLDRHATELVRLTDAFNRVADAITRQGDGLIKLLHALTAPPKPRPGMDEFFSAVFQPGEPKQPAAKPTPRKTKLSVVAKDGDDGSGVTP